MASASSHPEKVVRVELGERGYDVRVGVGLIAIAGMRIRDLLPTARRGLVVVDAGVPKGKIDEMMNSLGKAGIEASRVNIEADEQEKTLKNVERIWAEATRIRLERTEPIMSLGGGIIGDMAGFAAACYKRGVPMVQCPTTLLAMVDAAVGGKTGVNQVMGDGTLRKNMIGAFWQPREVICDVGALDSLTAEEFSAGLAECVKHAMIGTDWGDSQLMEWMIDAADMLMKRERGALIELIARNVAIKARVVAADEREESIEAHGGRMALNAGHTVGHAIEGWCASQPGLKIKHGHAVGLGLIAEVEIGERAGVTEKGTSTLLRELLKRLGLFTVLPGKVEARQLMELMLDDKKAAVGQVRLSVPTGNGVCRMLVNPSTKHVEAGLRAIGAK